VLVLEFVTARTVLNSRLKVAKTTISGENAGISLTYTRSSAVVSAAKTKSTHRSGAKPARSGPFHDVVNIGSRDHRRKLSASASWPLTL